MSTSLQPESLTVSITVCELAARAWGPADGPPVLALHGWLDNAATFDDLARRLPGLRIVALDLPGHGLSEHHPPGMLYGFVDLVAEVAEAADALGWERFALLGHSLGGSIASILAGTFPDRITRLAVVEGLGPLTEEPEGAPGRLAASLREEGRRRGGRTPVYATREEAAGRLTEASGLAPASAETLVERGTVEEGRGFVWRADPKLRVASRLRLSEAHVLEFLRRVTCPAIAIRALHGWPFDLAAMAKRRACVRDLEYVELPGRHRVHLDDPEAVAEVFRPFFAPLIE
jgi:pimeloyl-ACP methyl ester carboxylesterase